MHSEDPSKSAGAFWGEFQRLVDEAGTGKADFSGFVFPVGHWNGRCEAECIFDGAQFTGAISFDEAQFANKCWFGKSRFRGPARFYRTFFQRDAWFECWFESSVDFSEAVFGDNCCAKFAGATFAGDTRFYSTIFCGDADFGGTEFQKHAYFQEATFAKTADFTFARFLGEVRFRKTAFRGEDNSVLEDDRVPGLILTNAYFEKPATVLFYGTYLGRALLHSCDVSAFVFSGVRWSERRGSRKRIVFEEVVNIPEATAEGQPAFDALRGPQSGGDKRNYVRIAELYQQLKKNYDNRCDYWTAGDFHFGEMEVKRLSSPRQNAILRWLHRTLGLVAWYKYASQYGESYTRPLFLLIVVLLIFTFAYPFVGLEKTSQTPQNLHSSEARVIVDKPTATVTYFSPVPSPNAGDRVTQQLRLLGHSAMTSLYIAAFQKDLVYQPSYPIGRLLALIEILVTSTLLGLFLLAIRRQFRR